MTSDRYLPRCCGRSIVRGRRSAAAAAESPACKCWCFGGCVRGGESSASSCTGGGGGSRAWRMNLSRADGGSIVYNLAERRQHPSLPYEFRGSWPRASQITSQRQYRAFVCMGRSQASRKARRAEAARSSSSGPRAADPVETVPAEPEPRGEFVAQPGCVVHLEINLNRHRIQRGDRYLRCKLCVPVKSVVRLMLAATRFARFV